MAYEAREIGLDADEDGESSVGLVRAGLWGLAAAVTVASVLLAARTDTGARRLAALLEGAPATVQVAAPKADRPLRNVETEADTRRLNDTVQVLIGDRDRLAARLEALERATEVTGSVGRPAAAAPRVDAPADVATDLLATKTEFGIDLGRDGTLEGLRGRWAALRTQHAGLLDGLRPIVTLREGDRPGSVELHLVAGPLANAALAARLCATLLGVGVNCQPATFDGQRLALR